MTAIHDFDLRYDNRVLAFHAVINTDLDPYVLTKQIGRAIRGSQNEAIACWVEKPSDGSAIWRDTWQERNPQSPVPVLQHNGSVFACHVFINTDRDAYHIHKAVLRIARGPRLNACIVWSELYEGEDGHKVWTAIQQFAVKAHASPRAVPFRL